MEADLKESENMYRSLFENMTEGFIIGEVILDDKGEPYDYRFLDVNRTWEKLIKVPRERVVGKTYRELFPDVAMGALEIYGMVALTREPVTFERFYPNLNHWLSSYAYSPDRGKFAVIVTDITERKKAQEKIEQLVVSVQQERDKLSALVNSIPDEVWFADTNKNVTLATPEVLKVFGFSATDKIDVEAFIRTLEVYHQDGRPRPVKSSPILRALKGETTRNQEHIIRIPTSREFRHRQISAGPVKDADGNIIGAVAIVRDISKYKKMQAELQRARYKLEERVQERTTEIATMTRRLRTLSRRLIEIQEEERRNIARELHDQIGQSLNLVKMLLDRASDANGKDCQDLLDQARPQLAELIDRVSALSLDLRPKLLDDLGLVQALEWYFGRFTEQTNIRVRFNSSGIDKHLSRQIAISLYRVVQETLTNVARHAQATVVTVELKVDQSAVSLCVADNGIGFDPEAINISLSGGITGMQERILLVGGILQINSQPGAGTCVFAEIPYTAMDSK